MAWQPLFTAFINAYKAGGNSYSMTPSNTNTPAVGTMWYKTILQSSSCPGAEKPRGWETGTDTLNWAVVMPKGSQGMSVRGWSAGKMLQSVKVGEGLNWGSFAGLQAGAQTIELLDAGGMVVMSAGGGKCVSGGCPDGIYNMNVQVAGLEAGGASAGSC